MERRGSNAYTLLGYHLLANPQQPTTTAIAFETVDGPFLFAATREMLEELGEAGVHRVAIHVSSFPGVGLCDDFTLRRVAFSCK